MNFEIDFFQLLFLAQVCVPPQPIARTSFFISLTDDHYNKMSEDERVQMYSSILPKLDLKNEDCQMFKARFDPKNQYVVTTGFDGKLKNYDCFKFKDKYHTGTKKWITANFIVDIHKLD